MNSDRKIPWGKLVGGLLLLLVGFAIYKNVAGKEKPVTYETAKVEKKTVEAYVSATGTIESTTTVTVGSQVSGPVAEVLVDFNSPVSRGQVLARIDPSEFVAGQARTHASLQSATAGLANATAQLAGADAAVQQAQVAISAARVNLQQSDASVNNALAGVDTAKATLQSREVERENFLVQYKRSEDLVNRELVALSDRDMARTSYLTSVASVSTAEAGLQSAQAQLAQSQAQREGVRTEIRAAEARLASALAQRDAATAQVSAAQATVAQAQAGVDEANVMLQRTTITSPIDGVVIERKVDEGQTVAASFQAPELFVIARDLSQMQVKAEVSEADIGRVTEGAPVSFSVDAYPGRKFEGSVLQVRSAPDTKDGASSNVVVYGVLVTAANPEHLLKPGMTATVEILAEKLNDAVVIPNQALRFVPASQREESKTAARDGSRGRGRAGGRGSKPGAASASPTPTASETPSATATPAAGQTPAAAETPDPPQRKGRRGAELEPGTRRGVVWVLVNNKPEKRDVVTGISVQDDVVLVSGEIKPGDELILSEDTGEQGRSRFRLSF